MKILRFATLVACLNMASLSLAGTASTSVDPPLVENIITADATGTSFTRVFADPADHEAGNANHGRGNTFRVGGDGTGGTYQIDGLTLHKDVEQSFDDAAFGLTIYEGTVAQYGLGDGDADGDLFSGTGITNIPINQELFPLNGLTLGAEDFLTLTLDTPIIVDGDSDYGFALRYFPASNAEPNFVQLHETGGIGQFGLGEVRATRTGQEIRNDRRVNYSILGSRLTTGPISVDGVHSIAGEVTNVVKGEPTLTQGLTQYWYDADWNGNPEAFIEARGLGADAPDLVAAPFASPDTWWAGGQNTNILSDKELERYPQVGLAGTAFAGDQADDPAYSVRLAGEIFIPADGEYALRDGAGDFAVVAIDADGDGELGDLDGLFTEDVNTLAVGDSIGDVFIIDVHAARLDGSSHTPGNSTPPAGGLADIENIGADGDWRMIEMWMTETNGNGGRLNGLDAGILYMGNSDDDDIFYEDPGFNNEPLSQEQIDKFVVPGENLRSTVAGIESADSSAALGEIEYLVQVSADGSDSIVVDDNDGTFNTTLDVAGGTITVTLEGEVAEGTTFQILDADNIMNVGDVTLNLPDGFSADLAAGTITFGGGGGCNNMTMGDIDGDGTVGFSDFLILSDNFGSDVAGHEQGDLDCNGSVQFADFLVLSDNFGNAVGAETSSVPEPSGLALLSLAGLALGFFRRR